MFDLIDHIGILDSGSLLHLRMGFTPLRVDEENPVFASKLVEHKH